MSKREETCKSSLLDEIEERWVPEVDRVSVEVYRLLSIIVGCELKDEAATLEIIGLRSRLARSVELDLLGVELQRCIEQTMDHYQLTEAIRDLVELLKEERDE